MDRLHVSTVEARSNFSEVINRAAYGQCTVALTRRGKVVAAVVSPDDLDTLSLAKKRHVSYQLDLLEETINRCLEAQRIPEVKILGINATGPLHQGLEILTRLLIKGGTLKLLLLNPIDPVFEQRMDTEDDTVGRLQAELFASFYIIMDLLKRAPAGKVEIRLHNKEPDRGLLLINCEDQDGIVMQNPYPKLRATRGLTGKLYTFFRDVEVEKLYNENVTCFNTLWESGSPIKVVFPERRLQITGLEPAYPPGQHPEKLLGQWPFVFLQSGADA